MFELIINEKSLQPTVRLDKCWLLPIKREVTIPNKYIIVWSCSKGCKGYCNRSRNNVPGMEFCQCAGNCCNLFMYIIDR